MMGQRDRRTWWTLAFLLALGTVEWYTVRLPFTLAGIFHDRAGAPFAHPFSRVLDYEVLGFFARMIIPAVVLGIALSFVATALGPARVRALLNERQVWQFGGLATLVLCISLTGLLWANAREDELGLLLWGVIELAAAQIFTLVWLMLAVRAASAARPLNAGAQLIGGAVGTFAAAFGAIIALVLFLQDRNPEPTLALWAVVSVLIVALLILPPAILTCGVAALTTGVRRVGSAKPRAEE